MKRRFSASLRYNRPYSTGKHDLPPLAYQISTHGSKGAIISGLNGSSTENRQLYSYSQLDSDSSNVKDLIKSFSTPSRDPIAILAPNSYDFVKSLVGVWKSGSPAVPLCNSHPPAEWEYYINDSGSNTYIVHPSFIPKIEKLAEKRGARVISTSELYTGPTIDVPPVEWLKENAMLVYTSGTTGGPKGVVTTHGNIMASVEAMLSAWKWSPSDHILHVLPLHHVHGLVNALITPLSVGATIEMLPKFDAETVWNRFLQSHQSQITSTNSSNTNSSSQTPGSPTSGIITVFMAVPSIYMALIKHYDKMTPEKQKLCSESVRPLRLMVSGSAALPEPILTRWESISGHRLLERYGMTEIGMALTNPYTGGERKPGWVGKPFPGVEARIEADNTQSAGEDSIIGELYIKGPQVFKEYWKRPKATEDTFTKDGWFITGDVAEFKPSEGIYRLMGRKSVDILKTGGFKVSALDIETEILNHPDVEEVAIVGVQDLEWGDIIGAVIAPKPNTGTLDLKSLKEWCRPRMASYKIPRSMRIVPHLPRNAMGKVNKKELVRIFASPETPL